MKHKYMNPIFIRKEEYHVSKFCKTTKEGDARIIASPSQILLQKTVIEYHKIKELQSRNEITRNIVINISTK